MARYRGATCQDMFIKVSAWWKEGVLMPENPVEAIYAAMPHYEYPDVPEIDTFELAETIALELGCTQVQVDDTQRDLKGIWSS